MVISIPKRVVPLYNELVSSGTNPQFAVSFVEKYGPKSLDPTVSNENDNELVTFSLPDIQNKQTSNTDYTQLIMILGLAGIIILGIIALNRR